MIIKYKNDKISSPQQHRAWLRGLFLGVDRWVGNTDDHHVVLPYPGGWHLGGKENVEEDIAQIGVRPHQQLCLVTINRLQVQHPNTFLLVLIILLVEKFTFLAVQSVSLLHLLDLYYGRLVFIIPSISTCWSDWSDWSNWSNGTGSSSSSERECPKR